MLEDEYNTEWLLSERIFSICAICDQACLPAHIYRDYPICKACAARASFYQARINDRIARLALRADQKAAEAQRTLDQAHHLAEAIPFGQPILVGHHSEQWDRRYRSRIDATYQRGFEAQEDAQRLQDRVRAAERNEAISSDDPLAILKLQDKITQAEALQEDMKRTNRAVRRAVKLETADDQRAWLMTELGITAETASALLQPDFAGRVGVPSYTLRNNSANIRRMKKRLDDLRAQTAQDSSEQEALPGVTVIEAGEDNRLRLVFDDKPSAEIRAILKQQGWRWSPSNQAWQRYLNPASRAALQRTMEAIRKATS